MRVTTYTHSQGENRLQIKLNLSDFSRKLEIFIYAHDPKGKLFSAEPVVMKERKEGETIEPAIVLLRIDNGYFLNSLQTELEKLGFANPSLQMTQGELKATKEHLTDMRTLVFDRLMADTGADKNKGAL